MIKWEWIREYKSKSVVNKNIFVCFGSCSRNPFRTTFILWNTNIKVYNIEYVNEWLVIGSSHRRISLFFIAWIGIKTLCPLRVLPFWGKKSWSHFWSSPASLKMSEWHSVYNKLNGFFSRNAVVVACVDDERGRKRRKKDVTIFHLNPSSRSIENWTTNHEFFTQFLANNIPNTLLYLENRIFPYSLLLCSAKTSIAVDDQPAVRPP